MAFESLAERLNALKVEPLVTWLYTSIVTAIWLIVTSASCARQDCRNKRGAEQQQRYGSSHGQSDPAQIDPEGGHCELDSS